MGDQRHHEHKPRAWTLAEHAKLVALRKSGISIKQISMALDRPGSSVSGRLKSTDDNGQFVSRRNRTCLADMGVDDYILEMHHAGWSQEKIGLSIGFKSTSVGARIRLLMAKKGQPTVENPDRKHRTCICCRKTFASESWDHRRCSQCKRNMHRSEVHSDEYSIYV